MGLLRRPEGVNWGTKDSHRGKLGPNSGGGCPEGHVRLGLNKRKVSLSIKLLEELKNKEAVSKFSSPLSGKNLPFSALSDKLEKNQKKKEKK